MCVLRVPSVMYDIICESHNNNSAKKRKLSNGCRARLLYVVPMHTRSNRAVRAIFPLYAPLIDSFWNEYIKSRPLSEVGRNA